MSDSHRLHSRFRQAELHAQITHAIASGLLEQAEAESPIHYEPSAAELRGIPAVGRNSYGHIPGTSPHQEACR